MKKRRKVMALPAENFANNSTDVFTLLKEMKRYLLYPEDRGSFDSRSLIDKINQIEMSLIAETKWGWVDDEEDSIH